MSTSTGWVIGLIILVLGGIGAYWAYSASQPDAMMHKDSMTSDAMAHDGAMASTSDSMHDTMSSSSDSMHGDAMMKDDGAMMSH